MQWLREETYRPPRHQFGSPAGLETSGFLAKGCAASHLRLPSAPYSPKSWLLRVEVKVWIGAWNRDPAQGWISGRTSAGLGSALCTGLDFTLHNRKETAEQLVRSRAHCTALGQASGRMSIAPALKYTCIYMVNFNLGFKGKLKDFTQKWGTAKYTFTSVAFRGFGSRSSIDPLSF